MKKVIYGLAALVLVSFSSNNVETFGGLWTGAFRTDMSREKVYVRFDEQNKLQLYSGMVEENNRSVGTYEVLGDTALVFNYSRSDGKTVTMRGVINKRKTYVDGTWETSDHTSGSFYLKKDEIQELFITP